MEWHPTDWLGGRQLVHKTPFCRLTHVHQRQLIFDCLVLTTESYVIWWNCGFAPCVESAQTSKQSGWVKGIYSGYESPEKQTIHITNNTRRQYNKYIIYKCILYVGVVHMCVQCIHSSFISHSFIHTFFHIFTHSFIHSLTHSFELSYIHSNIHTYITT